MLDSDWVVSPFVPIGSYALLLLLRGVRDAGTWERWSTVFNGGVREMGDEGFWDVAAFRFLGFSRFPSHIRYSRVWMGHQADCLKALPM